MNDFDVIVVGLGPAGAAACVELAQGGARVLAIDGGSWRRKPCGGCLARRWEWLLDWLGLPNWAKSHAVGHFRLSAPGAPALDYASQNPGAFLLDRGRLDSWLAEKAGKHAAEVIKAKAESLSPSARGFTVRAGRGKAIRRLGSLRPTGPEGPAAGPWVWRPSRGTVTWRWARNGKPPAIPTRTAA